MRRLDIEDKTLLEKYLNRLDPKTSELTFTNLFMWRHIYKYHLVELGGYLWLISKVDEPFTMMPLGDFQDQAALEDSFLDMKKILESEGVPFRMERVDLRMVKMMEQMSFDISVIEDRASYDYVYEFEGLKTLSGKKYHKKKNHVNKFIKTYDNWAFETLHEDMMDDLIKAVDRWFVGKGLINDPEMIAERKAIHIALANIEILNFEGGVIRINDQIEAFTLGERLSSDTFVVHIEKANRNFNGLYNILNMEFLKSLEEDYTFVNREQDLGIEGLRKAKLSYKPLELVEKYSVMVL